MYANVDLNESDTEGQVTLYQGNVDSISGTIAKYNEKIEKLNVVKQCITARNNTFDASEGIYYSMISSYLASYNYTALQYDNQINEHQRQIDEYEEQMKKAEAEASIEDKTVTEEETVSDNGISTETISVVASTENTTGTFLSLKAGFTIILYLHHIFIWMFYIPRNKFFYNLCRNSTKHCVFF